MNLLLLSIGWIMLGVALMAATRLALRSSVVRRRDEIVSILNICAVVIVLLGCAGALVSMIGWLAFIVLPILAVVLLIALHQYRYTERRTLASLLTLAAESGTPLDLAADSLAAEQTGELGYRAGRLAGLLRKGIPLENALRKSRLGLPHDEHLALMLGAATGNLSAAVGTIARRDEDISELFTAVLNRLLYFALIFALSAMVITFIMLKIVPEFEKMFSDFDLELSWQTKLLVSASRFVVNYYWLINMALQPVFFVAMVLLLYRVGWIRRDIPFVFSLRRRWHTARLLRALAHGCRQNLPLPATLEHVYRYDAEQSVARRIHRALEEIEQGASWTTALLNQRLISKADQAVLESAQRAGNLPWAMEELADSNMRRLAHTIRVRMMILTPIVYGAFAVVIGFTVCALFIPIVDLIKYLT